MSGIAGVFGLDGQPVEASAVRRMSAASGDPPREGEDVWVRSSFGISYRHARLTPESLTEHQPLVSPSHTVVCFEGRLDNREELARPGSVLSDAAVVLAAYEQFGDRCVSRLNGDFALALFDSTRQQLLLARDVMAARCLDHCPLPGVILFASQIKCILADPRVTAAPDEDGLADLVLNNWHDDHRTCFKGIYSVPPGHLVVASREGVALRGHWAFDPSREVRYGSFEEYRDHFRALFEQSVRRRLRSAHPVAVTVSGGVDSSSIFCQAAALIRRESLPVRLQGISMTFPEGTVADERPFLDEVERACDARLTRVPVSQLRFLTDADHVIRQLETPTLAAHTHAEIAEAARGSGCRVILHGYFGDQMLFGRDYLLDLAKRGRWLTIRHDLQEFAAWMTDEDPGVFTREFWNRLCRAVPPRWLLHLVKQATGRGRSASLYSPAFTKAFRERGRARASARWAALPRFASAHAAQCYWYATSGHCTANIRLESGIASMHGVEARYPFRDRDLVAFLMAIPGEIVNWQGVPKGLLRHALADVLPPAVRDRRWKADFTDVTREIAGEDRAKLERLQSVSSLAVRAGLVDASRLAQSARLDYRLPDPVGLERWLLHFFGSSLPAG